VPQRKVEMTMLTREQILDADDKKTKTVSVPEWGGDVMVSTMTGFARDRFESAVVGAKGGINTVNIRAKLVAATVVSDTGELIFSEKDITKLGQKSAAGLDRVFTAAQELNKFSDDDVEDLAKN